MKSLYAALHVNEPGKPAAEPIESLVELTGREFSKAVVESRQYRESIIRRLLADTLSPVIEAKLMDHAWGRPPERVEHTGKDGKPIETITEVRRVIVRPSTSVPLIESDATDDESQTSVH